ncbi:putative ribonuclease H protein [Acorus gramineus]|uniref:Ribonuclease H protein n=1 Tax=Acorus gramineus TaxID=55184 RepID=A0AAV9A8S4_ACOGR|nr:putative ribonuclease H protein [Acorus gramineus]
MPSASAFLRSDALTTTRRSSIPAPRTTMWRVGVRMVRSETDLTGSCIRCFASGRKRVAKPPKADIAPSIDDEKDAFYVVRKGDLIGLYRSLSDCQEQMSPSVADPSVGVYKGYSLRKEAVEYLTSHGLRNAMHTIHAAHVKEDLLGTLVPCLPQVSNHICVDKELKKTSKKPSKKSKKNQHLLRLFPEGETMYFYGYGIDVQSCGELSYSIEFDGASKGNPGKAGAGAIIRTEDGTVVCRLHEGVGTATNNVAEYRALLLGMKYAIKKGVKKISMQGDSKLVCLQVAGKWKAKSSNMIDLLAEAEELKNKFSSFRINHVLREFNSEADEQANLAIDLPDGEVREVPE